MKRKLLGFLPVICALVCTSTVYGQSMSLGDATGEFGTVVDVSLSLGSDNDVQGLVAAFDWDDSNGSGVDLVPSAALADADVVQTRIESGYGVMGVVVDTDGAGPVAIPAGDSVVATLKIQCGDGPAASTTAVNFQDGSYATVDGGPALDNIIVVDGQSVGADDGLGLNSGSFSCTPPPQRMSISNGGNIGDSLEGSARVLLSAHSAVEGFVTAVCHGNGITLDSISVGSAAAAADFSTEEVSEAGGALGVVMDLEDPVANPPVIGPGDGLHIATYNYTCNNNSNMTVPLTLCDGVLGDPAKDNLIVQGGLSIGAADGLILENGTFTCSPVVIVIPQENCNNGVDDDEDGLVDADDPNCATTFLCQARGGGEITAGYGGSVEVCFAIFNPEDNAVGLGQPDHLQGFSMAVTFDSVLTASENLDTSGTILDALGAEFVNMQVDNDENDGDGRELIIGVLVDALPPFDGASIPPLSTPQPMGYVTFDVEDDSALCGTSVDISFTDGINGVGRVPIKNLVSAENQSRSPSLESCSVGIFGDEFFFRGDCNFSLMGTMSVDIADAASVIAYLFLPGAWQFQPGCLDACDANDDGRVDLADSVGILMYLFQDGMQPPAPGPGWDKASQAGTPAGRDPTEDSLDCALGASCDIVAGQ